MQSRSPEQQAGNVGRSARRRLIRGAFGAPAALTLYSGSVAAASLTCVARRVTNPINPTATNAPNADVYLRVQVRAKTDSNGNSSTWVSGADLLLVPTQLVPPSPAVAPAGSFLGSDNWYCLSSSNAANYTAGLIYTNADATDTNKGGVPQPLSSYVAVRINANGRFVGVTDTAGASAVSGSCWTSFARTI